MKYTKVSKDLIWLVIRVVVCLIFCYITYCIFTPKNVEVTIGFGNPVNLFLFSAWLILLGGITYLIFLFFFEGIPYIVRMLYKDSKFFEGVKKFDAKIPIYSKDLEAFDKKFKRKIVFGDKEFDEWFTKRIIKDLIKKELRGK